MADRLKSAVGRARYRRRKAIVEPVIGWIKEVLGFRRFSLRGVAKARGEWNVVCLAVNLKRLHRIRMGSGATDQAGSVPLRRGRLMTSDACRTSYPSVTAFLPRRLLERFPIPCSGRSP